MNGWIIFGIIAAVFILLLLAPVVVYVSLFDGVPHLEVRYLFFRLNLPSEKKKKASAPKKAEKKSRKADKPGTKHPAKKHKKEKAPWNAERVENLIRLIGDGLHGLGRSGRFFLRGIRVDTCKLQIMVVRDSVYETAMQSSRLNAVIYPVAALMQNILVFRDIYLNIYPGFWAEKENVAFETQARASLVRALGTALLLSGSLIAALVRFSLASRDADDARNKAPAKNTGSDAAS